MARVTRPGGHLIVFDFDYNAFFIDYDFAPMTRHIEALLAGDPRNPLIGRELPHLMRRAKLKIDAIEQTTLAPNVAVASRIYAAALSKGTEAGLFSAADVEAVVPGAGGNGARRNLLPCASRLYRCGNEAVVCRAASAVTLRLAEIRYLQLLPILGVTAHLGVGTLVQAVPRDAPKPRCALREVRARLYQTAFRDAVLAAYRDYARSRASLSPRVLDAAHIITDADEQLGQRVVPNGPPLTKIHHAPFMPT
jgi:hypothetical protein